MPAPQTRQENCVAHNGSLIPIPGREIMVQAWYQGGVSIFDWTDVDHPKEIAYFDRGPIDATRLVGAGSWSAYWYNGVIVSSEIARGLDIYELVPSALITENEIAAAKTVKVDTGIRRTSNGSSGRRALPSRALISISWSGRRVSEPKPSRRRERRWPTRKNNPERSARRR